MASHFEGTEKRIEIRFTITDENKSIYDIPLNVEDIDNVFDLEERELRDMTLKWRVLDPVYCAALDVMQNSYCKAVLLSESSMFLFKDRVILKTCGLTTLLDGVQPLIDLVVESTGGVLEYFLYSRRSYLYPEEQKTPHKSWTGEVSLLSSIFPDGVSAAWNLDAVYPDGTDLDGPDDHFHVFLADRRTTSTAEIGFLEVAMRELDDDVMQQFYMKNWETNEKTMDNTGLTSLMHADSEHNGFMFEPCGFSSNSLMDDTYYTVHITPEKACSYVSFETNFGKDTRTTLCDDVQERFSPGVMSYTSIFDSDLLGNHTFKNTYSLTPRVSISFNKEIQCA